MQDQHRSILGGRRQEHTAGVEDMGYLSHKHRIDSDAFSWVCMSKIIKAKKNNWHVWEQTFSYKYQFSFLLRSIKNRDVHLGERGLMGWFIIRGKNYTWGFLGSLDCAYMHFTYIVAVVVECVLCLLHFTWKGPFFFLFGESSTPAEHSVEYVWLFFSVQSKS